MPSMDWDDYLGDEAAMYRQVAGKTANVFGKQELLALAAVCEEAANSIEDRLTGDLGLARGPRPYGIALGTRARARDGVNA
jgi:hypothetical protein